MLKNNPTSQRRVLLKTYNFMGVLLYHMRVDTHGLTPVALAAEDHFISFEGFRTLKLPRKERFHLRAHARSPQLILDSWHLDL
jgi:hypothetical protein